MKKFLRTFGFLLVCFICLLTSFADTKYELLEITDSLYVTPGGDSASFITSSIKDDIGYFSGWIQVWNNSGSLVDIDSLRLGWRVVNVNNVPTDSTFRLAYIDTLKTEFVAGSWITANWITLQSNRQYPFILTQSGTPIPLMKDNDKIEFKLYTIGVDSVYFTPSIKFLYERSW